LRMRRRRSHFRVLGARFVFMFMFGRSSRAGWRSTYAEPEHELRSEKSEA
jgi:hypothetical protein